MAVRAWLMVQTEVGHARAVSEALASMTRSGVTVLHADTVTGPHDVIALVEAESLDLLTAATGDVASIVGGVQRVITCVAVS